MIFDAAHRRDTKGSFRTRPMIATSARHRRFIVNVFYKHSRIKQYLKDGRAMRIETVINAPRDLGCNAACTTSTNFRPRPVPSTAAAGY